MAIIEKEGMFLLVPELGLTGPLERRSKRTEMIELVTPDLAAIQKAAEEFGFVVSVLAREGENYQYEGNQGTLAAGNCCISVWHKGTPDLAEFWKRVEAIKEEMKTSK